MSDLERLPQFDLIRALAILGVVVIHTTALALGSADVDGLPLNATIGILAALNIISRYCVPAFFMTTAFFSTYQRVDPGAVWFYDWRYVLRRLLRLLPPYFFWSLAAYLPTELSNPNADLPGIILNFIFGNTFLGGYFIVVLVQFTLLEPFFVLLLKRSKSIFLFFMWASLIFPLLYFSLQAYLTLVNVSWQVDLILYFSMSISLVWFFYYLLGLYWGAEPKWLQLLPHACRRMWLHISIFTLSVSLLGCWGIYRWTGSLALGTSFFVPSTIAYSLAWFIFIASWQPQTARPPKVVIIMSEGSYAIFLTHGLVVLFFLRSMHVDFTSLTNQLLVIGCAIGLPLLFYQFTRRYLPGWIGWIMFGQAQKIALRHT